MAGPPDGGDNQAGASDLLRLVLEHTPDFISVLAPDGRLLDVNRTLPGSQRDDVLRREIWDYLPTEDHARIRACLDRVARTGQPESYETQATVRTGVIARYLTRVAPLGPPGRDRVLGCISTDVTSLHAAYRALRATDEKLRMAVDATKLGIWTWEPGERPGEARLNWDDRCCAIFGLTPDTLPRTREEYLRYVHPADMPIFLKHEQGVMQGRMEDIEYRIVRTDGSIRWVFGRGVMVFDQAGQLQKIFGGILDVTEQREMEQRLVKAQQKEALANLTAGVAHNFNNLLMAILPNTEKALTMASAEQEPLLRAVRDASERAAALVKDLMLFVGQRGSHERGRAVVADMVEHVATMCRASFPDHVNLGVRASDAVPDLLVNVAQIEQALLNLCLNARDAVATGTKPQVTLLAELLPENAPEIRGQEGAEGRPHVRFQVTDNGEGLSADVQRRIFEPFFTTKPVGKGTGLGLSSAFAIARQHGGWLTCDSRPGQGATFSLYLPVPTALPDTETVAPPPTGGTRAAGRVLVVDDDALVRDVVARILRSAGYDVLVAASGEEALAAHQAADPGVNLVLLDASMPGMSGRQVLDRLRARDPQVRVAVFTGRDDGDMTDAICGVLHKPVSVQQLLSFVGRATAT